jgi:hypothetical protein
LAASSFKVSSVSSVPGLKLPGAVVHRAPLPNIFIYQAPDRMEILLPDGSTPLLIRVGNVTYSNAGGFVSSIRGSGAAASSGAHISWTKVVNVNTTETFATAEVREMAFMALTTLQEAYVVTGAGPDYSFRTRVSGRVGTLDISGTVRIANGWVTMVTTSSTLPPLSTIVLPNGSTLPSLRLPGGSLPSPRTLDESYTFSEFNTAVINVPPASQVSSTGISTAVLP